MYMRVNASWGTPKATPQRSPRDVPPRATTAAVAAMGTRIANANADKRCAEVQVFAATSSVSNAEPRLFGPFAGSSAALASRCGVVVSEAEAGAADALELGDESNADQDEDDNQDENRDGEKDQSGADGSPDTESAEEMPRSMTRKTSPIFLRKC